MSSQQHIIRILLAFFMLALLQGCGFHLRGTQISDELQMETLSLITRDPYGKLTLMLIKRLENSDVQLVSSEQAADVYMEISAERFSRRAASTTNDISVAEYEIRMEVDLVFSNTASADGVNLPQVTLFEERVYSFDNTSLVGSGEEEALLQEEMRVSLVENMIRRANRAFVAFSESEKNAVKE